MFSTRSSNQLTQDRLSHASTSPYIKPPSTLQCLFPTKWSLSATGHWLILRKKESRKCKDALKKLLLSHICKYTSICRKDRQVYHFKKTPLPVSTYLIAVIVSDYESTPVGHFSNSYPGTGQIGRKEIRVWGQSTYVNQTRTTEAQAFGLALMEIYANDFAIPYAFDKLDQVGVVDFQGGMENWGLIFYR